MFGNSSQDEYHENIMAHAGVEQRANFIMKTYQHLFIAVLAFIGFEVLMFKSGMAEAIAVPFLSNWWMVLIAFMLVGTMASRFASTAESKGVQYFCLALYVVLQGLIFAPLLYFANRMAPEAISTAGLITMLGFSGLTAIAFVTRKDFSFMRGLLMWGMIIAFCLIVGAMIFGFSLGLWFSIAMVALAGGMILYDTSNVLHHYPEDRYVGASLQLFASLALLFWYVLQIVLSFSSSD